MKIRVLSQQHPDVVHLLGKIWLEIKRNQMRGIGTPLHIYSVDKNETMKFLATTSVSKFEIQVKNILRAPDYILLH